jgi:hypothetical protein
MSDNRVALENAVEAKPTFLCIPKLLSKATMNSLTLSLPQGLGPNEAQWQSFPSESLPRRRCALVDHQKYWYPTL